MQTSGSISLQDIENEFGGAGAIDLSEYYAGGAYVPGGTEGINGPIPTSGVISESDFYGAPLAPPPDDVLNFRVDCGQGDDENIFDTAAYALGYSRVWSSGTTIQNYGSIGSGSNHSDDGWGIDSVTLISEYLLGGLSDFEAGFVINFSNANFLSDRFRFDFDEYPGFLHTDNAQSDTWITVGHNSGSKNVRSVYWYLGSNATPQWPPWDIGERVNVTATRLY